MEKVFVALSGGVDSAVSASLLKKQGYDVVGVHMKMWHLPSQANVCTWQKDMEAAREAAEYLKIPFVVWDFTRQYQSQVVDYLFAEYAAGRTPNPDVMCNRHIKFGLFYDEAMKRGADYIATGHYARIIQNSKFKNQNDNSKFKITEKDFGLYRGDDLNKDQSYFLWATDQEKLSRIFFPVGETTKKEVREYARKIGLPNAERKDSQGICFVGKLNLVEFLKLRLPEKVGEVVNCDGRVIGEHRGSWFYTLGQRHGFGPLRHSSSEASGGGGTAWYVVDKDLETNRLVVAAGEDDSLYSNSATLGQVNWLVNPKKFSIFNFQFSIQTRYRQQPATGRIIDRSNEKVVVEFDEPVYTVAPGQSMVFYKDNKLLGGGVIEVAH